MRATGLPSGCAAAASATLTCSPTSPGTYEITLTVTDQNDGHGISSANLTVNAALLGLPSVEGYGIVVLVVLVLVAFVVVFLARRRRKTSPAEIPSIAERVREHTPSVGPAPLGTVVPASEVWVEAAPPQQITGWTYGVDRRDGERAGEGTGLLDRAVSQPARTYLLALQIRERTGEQILREVWVAAGAPPRHDRLGTR